MKESNIVGCISLSDKEISFPLIDIVELGLPFRAILNFNPHVSALFGSIITGLIARNQSHCSSSTWLKSRELQN